PNGCGKSSVLDGILFRASPHGQIGARGQRDHTYHSMTGRPIGLDNVTVDFVEGPWHDIFRTKQGAGKERTIFSFRSPYRYNASLKVEQSRSVPELRLNDYGATVCSDID